jgi:hypothetical protein
MTNAIALEFRADRFDKSKNFRFQFEGSCNSMQERTGYLFLSKHNGVETICVMQTSAVIKDGYSQEEIEQRKRLSATNPIASGDVVTVKGAEYTVKILGDYADAGYLVKKST